MNNFELCLINTVDELDNVFADTGVVLDFCHAVDNEMLAVDVTEKILKSLPKN